MHGQLGVHQDFEDGVFFFLCFCFFLQSCFPTAFPTIGAKVMHGGFLSQMQDFQFPFVERKILCRTWHSPLFVRPQSIFFQSFKGSFNGSTVIWSINHSAQFYVVCKLIAGALSAVISVTKQDVKTHNLLNLSKSDLAMVWDRSFSSCGCIPSCPIDLCLFCLFKNPLTWPYSTEGYLIQGFCTALRDLGLLNASLTSKHQGKEGIVYPGLVYVLYQQAPSPVLE